MIPAMIWFLQVAWYCLSIFFRSICSFPAKRFGIMSCFYSLGSISALCVTVFIMYFLSHRMQQAAQNFDSAAVPPPIPCPGNPQQAGLYNYPAYRTRMTKAYHKKTHCCLCCLSIKHPIGSVVEKSTAS